MMTRYFKHISALAIMLTSMRTMAGGVCDELSEYITTHKSVHFTCQNETGAHFGYDIREQRAMSAVYNVLKTPYSEYIRNQGVYSAIPDLAISQQTDPRTYLSRELDVGYLVAPYLLLKSKNQALSAFSLANSFPIDQAIWRGDYSNASFNLDKVEREMFSKKGDVVAMYGLISTQGGNSLSHVYRVYFQPQYQLSIAFLLPLSTSIQTSPYSLISSIDCIESLANVNLLSFLDEETQADIENKKAYSVDVWARKDGNREAVTCE